MTNTAASPTSEADFLSMSDEEIMNLDISLLEPEAPEDEIPSDEDLPSDDGSGESGAAGAAEAADDTAGEEEEEEEIQQEEEGPGEQETGSEETLPEQEQTSSTETSEEAAPNFEEFYQQITAPFKANGKELQVKNAQEAIQLMQMGANYNKKMAALKPNLKLLKLLETNNLLDEQKLGFLIDIDKKNPEAIAQLIKSAGIDPMDINVDAETGYTPTSYNIDDRVIELDTVLDEIKDSPTFDQTLSVISDKWDVQSKQVIANAPQTLKVINDHIAVGIYDLISAEMERQRMFGQLTGLSDIEAYRQVGDKMNAEGKFDHLVQGNQGQQTLPPGQKINRSTPPANPGLKDKKRAASAPKAAAPAKPDLAFNPLAVSDEEFEKLFNEKFL